MGATVVGLDASMANIATAQAHYSQSEEHLAGTVEYRATTAEAMVAEGEKFDVVCSFEVVEHVADANKFVQSCAALAKDGGGVFFSTISKTEAAHAIAIFAAEQVLRVVPPGTHDWDKFITPHELTAMLRKCGVCVEKTTGTIYNPLTGMWTLAPVTAVNYIMFGIKDGGWEVT